MAASDGLERCDADLSIHGGKTCDVCRASSILVFDAGRALNCRFQPKVCSLRAEALQY